MNGSDQKVTPIDDEVMESAPFWLKAIVVGLGLAILGMLGLILYKIIMGPGDKQPGDTPQDMPTINQSVGLVPAPPSGDFDIDVPAGAALVTMVPSGPEVFLHFRLTDGSDQIIVLNRVTGETSTVGIQSKTP